jgi:antitoxin ParD1/3/4
MNISLPENLKGFVDSQVQMGGYSTSSEYIRELIREDQKKKLEQRLSLLLLEGTQSGERVASLRGNTPCPRREDIGHQGL